MAKVVNLLAHGTYDLVGVIKVLLFVIGCALWSTFILGFIGVPCLLASGVLAIVQHGIGKGMNHA